MAILTHILQAHAVTHVLARVVTHVLARVVTHVLARVIMHVHDYYLKTCILDDVCEQKTKKESPCQVSNFGAKCRVATPSRLLWTMVKNTALSSVSQILALTGGLGSVTK